ncbi:drug/metabolite transporter (DMT)-like permease [Inquilinus ginsengisoli]|uniref:Drug/metabolite transporter (DMT)-like permease n=1 Tax=Inquilinus ginsengisoli TaxID=363840 RepID=A0ABU1JLN8_9PROT|nr:DMT family transporter [Inquilinus ginsengisoli]MDR6289533.1 drug/metabolite transporter (DMT)-like permease [Inquilinus ginsengisoli]
MTALLFLATALLWGGGALATALQAGSVPATVSVGYRMALAGLVMLAIGAATGTRLRLARADLPWVLLQGVLFFGLAFIAFYSATRLIPSGLAALVLSLSAVFAGLLGRLFLGTALTPRLLAGLGCGVLGVAIVFGGDLRAVAADGRTLAGLAWAAVSALATAGGTILGARNQRRGVPIPAVMGWGALTGAAAAFAWSAAAGADFAIDPSPRYLGSLAYLAIAASCVTFLMYFDLVRRIGPARTAYTLALVPVVALALSAGFEGLALGPGLLLGAAIILAGNMLVLRG